MITVKKITAEDTYDIRLEVFIDENLVGVYSIMKRNNTMFHGNQYQLRGMASLPKVIGKGCGKKMIDYITRILQLAIPRKTHLIVSQVLILLTI